MEDKMMFNVTVSDDGFNINIGGDFTGDQVMQGLAALVHNIGTYQRKSDKLFKDQTIVGGLNIWLRLLNEDQ